jgi:hypothetical protein
LHISTRDPLLFFIGAPAMVAIIEHLNMVLLVDGFGPFQTYYLNSTEERLQIQSVSEQCMTTNICKISPICLTSQCTDKGYLALQNPFEPDDVYAVRSSSVYKMHFTSPSNYTTVTNVLGTLTFTKCCLTVFIFQRQSCLVFVSGGDVLKSNATYSVLFVVGFGLVLFFLIIVFC